MSATAIRQASPGQPAPGRPRDRLAVIHGVRRYGWLGFSAYAAITLVVSFGLENLSIATGFPFGHYHYTAQGVPYLGTVPVQIGVIYVALGYVCWITASALLDGADQRLGDRTNPARRVDLVAGHVPLLPRVRCVPCQQAPASRTGRSRRT